MPVKEADPNAKSLDEAFAAAMGAPPRPREPGPPAPVDPDAPHGRDEAGNALTPFGLTKEGKPRRSAAGRPPKEDQARTAEPATAKGDDKKPAGELAEPGQYAKQLSDTADGVWFAASALGKAAPGIPLIGSWAVKHNVPEKIQAQAAVWYATKDRAVAAVSLAAEHNAAAARFAAKLKGDDVTWMITCISLVAPIVSLSGMIWAKDADVQLKEAEQPTLAELAERNDKAMGEAIAQITAKIEAAAAEQVTSLNGQAAA